MWEYRAVVQRVVDGDTVDLLVDRGFRDQFKDRFRMFGIDTPERGEVGWSEATQALSAKIPPGTTVLIQSHHPRERDEADKYGRWLATIFVDGVNVNEAMVTEGFAKVYLP